MATSGVASAASRTLAASLSLSLQSRMGRILQYLVKFYSRALRHMHCRSTTHHLCTRDDVDCDMICRPVQVYAGPLRTHRMQLVVLEYFRKHARCRFHCETQHRLQTSASFSQPAMSGRKLARQAWVCACPPVRDLAISLAWGRALL